MIYIPLTLFLVFGENFYHIVEFPMWKSKQHYIISNHESKNIILGDSRAVAGFYPDSLGSEYYNLALGGGTAIETYYAFQKYIENQKVDTLIISFAPFHLEMADSFFERTIKYDYLSIDQALEVNQVAKAQNEIFWKFNDETTERFSQYGIPRRVYSIKFKWLFDYRFELKRALLNPMQYVKNQEIYKLFETQKGYFQYGTKSYSDGINQEAIRKHFIPSKTLTFYLKKLISEALRHGATVYYISTPLNQSSCDQIKPSYVKGYELFMTDLKHEFAKVKWKGELHCIADDYFGDPSHLNSKGVIEFGKLVGHILKLK